MSAAGGAGWGRVFSISTKGATIDGSDFNGANGSFANGSLVWAANGTLSRAAREGAEL